MPLMQVRFLCMARDFFPESTFSVDSLSVSAHPCVQSHALTSAHDIHPVVHVRVQWIMATQTYPARTISDKNDHFDDCGCSTERRRRRVWWKTSLQVSGLKRGSLIKVTLCGNVARFQKRHKTEDCVLSMLKIFTEICLLDAQLNIGILQSLSLSLLLLLPCRCGFILLWNLSDEAFQTFYWV